MGITCLKCVRCGQEHNEQDTLYYCSHCGREGILDIVYDYDAMKRAMSKQSLSENIDFSMWRYFPALPLYSTEGIQPLQVGWTPLYPVDRIRRILGAHQLYIKDESRNPTGSFKDRASAVGIAKALELGRDVVCAASTGNAATSISGFAASAGLKTYIFVPETAPEAKVAQLLVFGSTVFLVRGSYDQAYDLCFSAAAEFGWYNRSCAINPYLVEGKKTVAYEICEQMGWEAPDVVVMAVGDGCSIAGAWKGFRECLMLGLIDRLPKMIGVQAEGANPLTRAFDGNTVQFEYRLPRTLADSISVGVPRNGIKGLQAVRESGGFFLDVSDDEILRAMKFLAENTGIFGEPAGVASLAGLRKALGAGLLTGEEKVVCLVTGSGLKDIKSAVLASGKALHVEPDIEALYRLIREDEKNG